MPLYLRYIKVGSDASVVNTLLGLDLLAVCVFDLPHLGNRMRPLDYIGMRVPAREDKVHETGFAVDQIDNLRQVDEFQLERVVYLVKYQDIEFAGQHFFFRKFDRVLCVRPVFFVRVRVAHDTAKALAGQVQLNVRGKPFYAVHLTGIQVAFHELDYAHMHAVPHCPQRHAHGGRRLAFPVAGYHDNQTHLLFRLQSLQFNCFHIYSIVIEL